MAQPGRPPKPDPDAISIDEADDLAEMMMRLGKRARVVRSYVKWVMDEGYTVKEWRAKKTGVPSPATWTLAATKGGRYWGTSQDHDPDFRGAIQLYWAEVNRVRIAQHLRLAAKAERTMAMAVPDAAQSLVKLSTKARNEQTKYNAARFLVQQRTRAEVTADADAWDEAEADAAQDDE